MDLLASDRYCDLEAPEYHPQAPHFNQKNNPLVLPEGYGLHTGTPAKQRIAK